MIQNNTFFQNPGRLLGLIVSCLLLLGLSQVLWINKVWHEQKNILRQESNYIFQKTVLALQDSLVRRSMTDNGLHAQQDFPERSPLFDHPRWERHPSELHRETSVRLRKIIRKDKSFADGLDSGQIQVIISTSDSQPVSLQRGLGRFLLGIRNDSMEKILDDVVFEFRSDTIASQELRQRYASALEKANLPGTFTLLTNNDPGLFVTDNIMATEPVPAGLLRHHFSQAIFQNYQWYLFQKILPYTLFSLFLFALTSLAFWLIFNNLKQQQKLSQQKSEFVSNVSHELKTPLTTVGVALEALHDFDVLRNPEKAKEYLNISKIELNRLNLLVDKVLRLSMFEQQALTLQPETFDLAGIVNQVVSAMSLQAKAVGATIQLNNGDQQAAWVSCDRLHLTGVVYNLLDNALKYRREAPEIVVSIGKILRDNKAFITLKISDNGLGIAPEYQKQIFEKFFRVPAGDTHNVKGHGLGLSYVAHVLQEHGGAIVVESHPGEGSTFIVEIPAVELPPTA